MEHEWQVLLPSCTWTKWPRMHYCNCVMFAGSAQNIAHAGCLRALPVDKVATYACLHMRDV